MTDLSKNDDWIDALCWDGNGLIPVIAQAENGDVLMFAFMNHEALQLSLESGFATYWSRSRNRLWMKGEESGHRQKILNIQTDCDKDVILLTIVQMGGIACHTGRKSCFFNTLEENQWAETLPVLKDPKDMYGH